MIKTAVAVVALAVISTIGVISAPAAFAAYPITGKLGSALTMTDSVGQVVLSWKVSELTGSVASVRS